MIGRVMTDSRAMTASENSQTLRSLGKDKPLLYLPDDRSAAVPQVLSKLAQTRLIAIPLPGADIGSQTLAQLFNSPDITLCDVIACGHAAEIALHFVALHPDLINKIVIDTPLVAGGFHRPHFSNRCCRADADHTR